MEFLTAADVDLTGHRREFVLREPRLGHYEEFSAVLRRHFHLSAEDAYQGRLIYLRADSGRLYELSFLAGSGGPFPSGLGVSLLVKGSAPTPPPDEIDADIWAFLRWLVQGIGGEWTPERLDRLGQLYGLPFATPPQ